MKQGWKTSTLGDVLDVLRNGLNCKQDKRGKGERISRIESISEAIFDLKRVGYAQLTEREKERYRLMQGDILFSHINSVIHVGKTALFDGVEPVYHGVNLLLMRPKESLTSAYLQYALMYLFSSGYWRGVCKQSVNQASVNQQDISRVEICFPEALPEQQRIAALLDEAFACLATAKATAEQNLQNARALFESHLQAVFCQRGEGWVETTLDKISTNLDSRRVPITKNLRSSGEYPYYGASGIVDYVADYIFEGDNLLVSEDGANLLARTTPVAFSVTGRYWVNNHAHILHFDRMATQRFVEFYLESIKLDEFITGAAQPKLNQRALNAIPIPIPESVEEQAKIVNGVKALQEETRHLTRLYERKLAALEELKKSLLHQAFNGEL
ncbi:MAG: restriction endonuclease subunit S [Aphanothece saxicola GSE-SYN-MK-01-06B]|jgi:type I restriction enzyme S subunit|nr:restriction endonuclease subunit S [Aphanothece saxicola GSE-SYN-MK-01-06B]